MHKENLYITNQTTRETTPWEAGTSSVMANDESLQQEVLCVQKMSETRNADLDVQAAPGHQGFAERSSGEAHVIRS